MNILRAVWHLVIASGLILTLFGVLAWMFVRAFVEELTETHQ